MYNNFAVVDVCTAAYMVKGCKGVRGAGGELSGGVRGGAARGAGGIMFMDLNSRCHCTVFWWGGEGRGRGREKGCQVNLVKSHLSFLDSWETWRLTRCNF